MRPHTKFRQSTAELLMTELNILSRPVFPLAILSGTQASSQGGGAWTDLYQIWRGHRAVVGAPEVCFRFPICCFLSKPGGPKSQILYTFYPPLKIRTAMGEISKSIFRRTIYTPNARFRFPICCSALKPERFKPTGSKIEVKFCTF